MPYSKSELFLKNLVLIFSSIVAMSGCGSSSSPSTQSSQTVNFTQIGLKLVGTGSVGASQQGQSVAMSGDGNTAIVGAEGDNNYIGGAWIYIRSGSSFVQQGTKLIGTGAVGGSAQGNSVAISSDGNTVIVGGLNDNTNVGAAWVFTRSGTTWTQQGVKLFGTGSVGLPYEGFSVALSADGNTALVGGYRDNSGVGAAWVFTRSAGVWSQQGSKLLGTGATGNAAQGTAVALSADGNTAFVGGGADNSGIGAFWVFNRLGGVWTQNGSKIVGAGAVNSIHGVGQGAALAVSSDGCTVITGGSADNSNVGAAWVFTCSGGTYVQQGTKLLASNTIGNAQLGYSVAMTADGNTALVGGWYDNSNAGAIFVFSRSNGTWSQQQKLIGTGAIGVADQGYSASLSSDGKTAIFGGFGDNSSVGAAWMFTQ